MNLIELLLIAIGLSMDAFAISICSGLAMPKATLKNSFIIGAYFGIFQGGMPLIGYALATLFSEKVVAFGHWIAFALLAIIGIKMIIDNLKSSDSCEVEANHSLMPSKMIPLAIATSIDAMAVGVSFAFLQVAIIPAVSLIGVATFLLSAAGVKLGNIFGTKLKSKAGLAGGIILVLMGIKILFE